MTKAQVLVRECTSLRHPGQMRIVANLDLFHLDFSPVALIIYVRKHRTVRAQHLGVRYARQGIIQRRFIGN